MDNDAHMPEDDALEEVAVIGLAGRFPGGTNIDHYWLNLLEGIECITHFTDDELTSLGIPHEWLTDANYVKAGTILEDFDKFDAALFGYSPVEAESIDPQQRIFLETAWEALENAGYNPETYDGAIGVFAGSNPNHYQDLLPHHNDCRDVAAEMERLIGNEKDFLCTRVSYKLNLRGPSITVQTGCSTSLVAVHMACQNLLNYQCAMALAGGVSINLKQCSGYFFQDGTIGCPDGHCRAFDAKAQGTVLGQGVGIVVLKRLSEALADGDSIYAVIKATAINNDGALKAGYTAPSVDGQAEVIAMAQALAGVSADTISYIEAHGTGTALGDPIEIAALTQAFRASTSKKGFCAIGSVKTNIGHADAAAGIAGLIKTILMLRHQKIPPSLHFNQPNPNIDFENSPFYVPTRPSDWAVKGFPRRAGVSSFGIGGTNAHAILEEAPEVGKSGKSRPCQLLLISGQTASGLDEHTKKLGDHLRTSPHLNVADMAYTLSTGRKTLNYRRAFICRDIGEATARFAAKDARCHWDAYMEPAQRDVVFLFSGQGSQYVDMGLELYQGEAVFREAVDRCCDTLQAHLGFDLRTTIYPSAGANADVAQQLRQTSIAQPALFTIEYALAQLWMSWGVKPEAMVGHSIGEYVAGCLAQVFSLDDALSLVAARGRLMQQMPAGSMLAVSLSEAEIQDVLGDDLCLAAVNAPGLCVVSGENEAIEGLEKTFDKQGVSYTRLHTSHAFHSKMMDPILVEFEEAVRQVQLNAPQIPIMSNTTGSWMQAVEATDPGYWVRHLRQAVRFSDSIQELLGDSSRILLEVGPGQTLCVLAKQHIENPKERVVLSSMRHPKEERSDVEFILTTLGKLWLAGVEVNWQGFYQNERRQRIALPTYPFQRQRFWIHPQNAPQGYPAYQAALTEGAKIAGLPEEEGIQIGDLVPRDAELQSDFIAPRNEIEKAIADMWKKLLGVKRIGIHDDYFDLGGTSILATRLFAEIERQFNKKLPLATMINAPTIEKLSTIVRDENWSASWSPLVALQERGSNPPFFCIHGADGLVFIYRDLAHHLGSDQPVYGLQSQGLDGEHAFLTRIEDMASLYIEEIKTIQPEGPYYLGGYCMGGTIAFEIAQQLKSQGQSVAMLVMLETYNWVNFKKPSFLSKSHYYMQKVDFHLRNLFIAESKWAFLNEKMQVAKNRSKMWANGLQAKIFDKFHHGDGFNDSLARLWEINDQAAANYRPKVYSGCITQFRPVKEYTWYRNSDMGWENLTTEGVEDHVLHVYPAGMLIEPFVKKLSGELKACINKAVANSNHSGAVSTT